MRWHHSGLRRDVCVLLADEERTGQKLKVALETHYDDRVDGKQFYAALDRLVENGHVDRETEGIADAYSLTEAGRDAVDEQLAWMRETVD